MEIKILGIKIEKGLAEKFKKVCKKQDRSMSLILRDYIRWYIEEFEKKENKKQN